MVLWLFLKLSFLGMTPPVLAMAQPGTPKIQISVSEFHITQVVPDFGFDPPALDLVQGKSAVAQVFITGTNIVGSDLDPATSRSVDILFQSENGQSAQSQSILLSTIAAHNSGGVTAPKGGAEVDFYFTPKTVTAADKPQHATVTIDPHARVLPAPILYPAISAPTIDVDVTETRPINLGFVPIDGCGDSDPDCYFGGHLTEYASDVKNASTFVQAVYPIPDHGSFMGDLGIKGIAGSPYANFAQVLDHEGITNDLITLGIIAKTSVPQMDFVGGVVPLTYFAYHNVPHARGMTSPGFAPPLGNHSFLTTDTYWDGAAHEIGHLMGNGDYYGNFFEATHSGCDGNPVFIRLANSSDQKVLAQTIVSGFWPAQKMPIFLQPSMMCTNTPNELIANWMDPLTYGLAFQYLKRPLVDPPTLLVAGALSSTGDFQLNSLRFVKNGILSPGGTGNFSLNILGQSGEMLYELKEQTSFFAFFDPSTGIPADDVTTGQVPMESIPVILSVPYPLKSERVEIVYNGRVVFSASPHSQLLFTAIESISDSSFKHDPIEGKAFLLSRVHDIDRELKDCQAGRSGRAFQQQVSCLDHVVIKTLELRNFILIMLNKSKTTLNALEMSKRQILETVDAVILHLRNRQP